MKMKILNLWLKNKDLWKSFIIVQIRNRNKKKLWIVAKNWFHIIWIFSLKILTNLSKIIYEYFYQYFLTKNFMKNYSLFNSSKI